jgi:hypothetical protein
MASQTAEILTLELPLQLGALTRALVTMPEAATGAAEDFNALLGVLAKFDRQVDAAETDPLLSPAGKQDAVAKAGRVALAGLDAFTTAKVGGLDARIAGVTAAIQRTPKPATDIADAIDRALRATEIRRQLASLDQLERTAAYYSTTDVEVREAMETAPLVLSRSPSGGAPAFEPLIDASLVRDQQMARAEARDPARAGELRDLDRLKRAYAGVVNTARAAILSAVPSLRPDAPVLMA